MRADVNVSHSDGWRPSTDYDRQSGTVRWDAGLFGGRTHGHGGGDATVGRAGRGRSAAAALAPGRRG